VQQKIAFAVINGFNPELVQQAKFGKMCMPVPSGSDPTLAVKLEAIQDQLTLLTLNKTRTASPVCFADRSESRGHSSRPGSPARRVRFDRSADRGVLEYRNTGPREDRRSRSNGRQSPNNNWDSRGHSQRWDAGPPNRDRSRSGGFRGRGFNQRQGQLNTAHPVIPAPKMV